MGDCSEHKRIILKRFVKNCRFTFHLADGWKDSCKDHKQHQGSIEVRELLTG